MCRAFWCMMQCCLMHDTLMSGAWYRDVWCMVQWCLVYGTVVSGVRYSGVWYTMRSCSNVLCMMYHTILLWYSDVWCMIQWFLVYMQRWSVHLVYGTVMLESIMSGARSRSAVPDEAQIFGTWPHCHCVWYQTDITDTYTRHNCVVHKISLYRTPNITVYYTRHHCR